jgi:hypothetical protein
MRSPTIGSELAQVAELRVIVAAEGVEDSSDLVCQPLHADDGAVETLVGLE